MSHVKRTWQAYSSVITVSIKIPTWFRKISPLTGINKTIWSRFHDCNALIGFLRLICEINTRSLNRHVVKYEFVENEWWKSCQEDLELSSGAFYHHAPDRKFHCIQTVPGRFITTKWHGIFDKTTTGFHNETAVFKSIQTSKCFVNVQSLHLSPSLRSRVKLMNIKQKTLFLFLLQINI